MTIQLQPTPEILKEIHDHRYNHPVPLVQRRMEALWLKGHGLAHAQIAELVGVTENTIRNYFELYQQGGVEKLKELNYYVPESKLNAHVASLEAHFRDHPPASIKEAQAGQRVVLFADAAHFVLAPFLGFLWSVVRVFVQAPSGRQRFHVLGALNAITHELITVTNDTYITAESVCVLLEKIANRYVGIPISIFLDNARYQNCALVIEKAKSLNIELCFLPSYSPNLNLIERVWKFVKKKCLYSKYYEKFPAFKAAISKCLNETMTTHKSDLDSLLTLRFQLFQKAQFVTV